MVSSGLLGIPGGASNVQDIGVDNLLRLTGRGSVGAREAQEEAGLRGGETLTSTLVVQEDDQLSVCSTMLFHKSIAELTHDIDHARDVDEFGK